MVSESSEQLYKSDLARAIKEFPWQSEEQKQGYLALVQYTRNLKGSRWGEPFPDPVIGFFIQKDIDAHDYWRELMGNQISDLQNQIKLLQDELRAIGTQIYNPGSVSGL